MAITINALGHISERVSDCAPRRRKSTLRSLVEHHGCVNADASTPQLLGPHRRNSRDESARTAHWPGAGRRTHMVVRCPFNRSRLVQRLHKRPPDAPGRAIARYQGNQGNRAFCRRHIFALYSPKIQQASLAGQESFCPRSLSFQLLWRLRFGD